jgi:methyl-accepting chemotaxis protein
MVILVSGYFLNRAIKPVKRIQQQVKNVSEENLASTEIKANSKDEIGELANDLQSLVVRFRNILGDVTDNSMQVAATSQQLLASSKTMFDISDKNSKELNKVSTLSKLQLKHTDEIHQILQSTAKSVQTISDQLKEFVNVSKLTADESIVGIQVMNESDVQMNEISQRNIHIKDIIVSLQNKSDEINEIINVINNISNQTNILSLNATIEAARAGELGKGFSVVAEQIRNFAAESSKATEKISDLNQFHNCSF